jgi:hypothetical protein
VFRRSVDPLDAVRDILSSTTPNWIVVRDRYTANHGNNNIPLLAPRGKLCVRIEAKPALAYISVDQIRLWLKERKIEYGAAVKRMEEVGCLVDRSRRVALGAGTEFSGPAVQCWAIRLSHPEMSGVHEIVPELVVNNIKEHKNSLAKKR